MTSDLSNKASIQAQGSNNVGLGKVLTSGGGLRFSEKLLYGVVTLVVAGLIAWVLCVYIPAAVRDDKDDKEDVRQRIGFLGFQMPNPMAEGAVKRNAEKDEFATRIFFFGIVLAIGTIIGSVWNISVATSSKITVYERGIDGVFPNKTCFYTRNIQLLYDRNIIS